MHEPAHAAHIQTAKCTRHTRSTQSRNEKETEPGGGGTHAFNPSAREAEAGGVLGV